MAAVPYNRSTSLDLQRSQVCVTRTMIAGEYNGWKHNTQWIVDYWFQLCEDRGTEWQALSEVLQHIEKQLRLLGQSTVGHQELITLRHPFPVQTETCEHQNALHRYRAKDLWRDCMKLCEEHPKEWSVVNQTIMFVLGERWKHFPQAKVDVSNSYPSRA